MALQPSSPGGFPPRGIMVDSRSSPDRIPGAIQRQLTESGVDNDRLNLRQPSAPTSRSVNCLGSVVMRPRSSTQPLMEEYEKIHPAPGKVKKEDKGSSQSERS